MTKKMTDAAKKAMANRGTFEVGGNTDFPTPYSMGVMAAVAPYIRMQRWMVREWGGSLMSFVPPAWADKYQKQVSQLHTAMVDEDVDACVQIATDCCKAIEAMHGRAKAEGRSPMPEYVLTTQRGDKTYMVVGDGDISVIRRQNPEAVIYTVEEAAAALEALSSSLVGKITEAFPSSSVTRISGRPKMDDEFEI